MRTPPAAQGGFKLWMAAQWSMVNPTKFPINFPKKVAARMPPAKAELGGVRVGRCVPLALGANGFVNVPMRPRHRSADSLVRARMRAEHAGARQGPFWGLDELADMADRAPMSKCGR